MCWQWMNFLENNNEYISNINKITKSTAPCLSVSRFNTNSEVIAYDNANGISYFFDENWDWLWASFKDMHYIDRNKFEETTVMNTFAATKQFFESFTFHHQRHLDAGCTRRATFFIIFRRPYKVSNAYYRQ